MDKSRVAGLTLVGSLAVSLFINLDRIAKVFGILNIPKDAKEFLTLASQVPTLISEIFVVVAIACVFYLYSDHLKAVHRRFWRPKLDLVTVGLLGIVFFAVLTGIGLWMQPSPSTASTKNAFSKNIAGQIEWRFDKPVTLFIYSRRAGEAVRIEAIQIHATNKSDFALKNVRASISADLKDQAFAMRVNPHGTYISPDQSANLIPPRADFDLMMQILPNGGLSAEDFLAQYGALKFSFDYEHNGSASNFSEIFPLTYLEDQISFIEEQTKDQRRAPVREKKSESSIPSVSPNSPSTNIPIYNALKGQVQHDMYTYGSTVRVGPKDKEFLLRFSSANTDCVHMYKDSLSYLARVRGRSQGERLSIAEYPDVAASFTIAVGERFLGMNQIGQMIQGQIVGVKYDGRGADHHEVTFNYLIAPARGGDFLAL